MSAIRLARRPVWQAGDFGQTLEKDQQPARRADDRRNLLIQGTFGEAVDLDLPIGDAFEIARREVAQPRPAGHGARLDPAQVAAEDPPRLADQAGRAAQHEDAPGKQPALRPIGEMVRHHFGARPNVRAMHLPAHGNVLRGPGRRSRRNGEPGDEAGPRAIGEAREGCAPIRLPERIVIAQRNARAIVVKGPGRGEFVVPAKLCASPAADERGQNAALRLLRLHRLKLSKAPPCIEPQKPGCVVHGSVAGVSASLGQFSSVSVWGKLARTPASVRGTRT